MNEPEYTPKLLNYLIRPRSQDLEQVKRLKDKINSSLLAKKLSGECALMDSTEILNLVETDLGAPALAITCTAELAKLIVNLKDIFRVERNPGHYRRIT